jgi:hypothetical protein
MLAFAAEGTIKRILRIAAGWFGHEGDPLSSVKRLSASLTVPQTNARVCIDVTEGADNAY